MKKWHFIVAAIFLFNPILSTLDILPDFIGYLLLLKAFHNMSYIDDKAQDVCKGMKIMSIITVIKFFAFFLVPALDTTMYLVFSFVFAILEIIFGIGPIIKMFDCFSEYALLGENVDPANNSKIKIFSIVALVSKVTLAFIPDLTFLAINDGVSTPTGIDFASFRPVLFVLTAFVSIIIGIIWLVLFIIYVSKLLSKEVVLAVDSKFKEKTENRKALFLTKAVMFFLIFLCIGSVFTIDFNYQYINVFMDSIFSVFIAITFIVLTSKGYFNKKESPIALSALATLHLLIDIIFTVKTVEFFEIYDLNSIFLKSEAEDLYFEMCNYSIVSALIFIAVIVVALLALRSSTKKILNDNIELLAGTDKHFALNEFSKESVKQIIPVIVSSVVCAVSYVCYIAFRHMASVTTIINSVCEIIFVVLFIRAIVYFYDNVYKRLLAVA